MNTGVLFHCLFFFFFFSIPPLPLPNIWRGKKKKKISGLVRESDFSVWDGGRPRLRWVEGEEGRRRGKEGVGRGEKDDDVYHVEA